MSNKQYEDRSGNFVYEQELLKNRNASEQMAIKYFMKIPKSVGCFSKEFVTDSVYEQLVRKLIGDVDDQKLKALKRLGLDEEQVNEIPPVYFEGYAFIADEVKGLKKDYVVIDSENRFVTPTKELTWIFFGDEQIYVYLSRIDTVDNALRSEETQEYFYKDITAFSTQSESYTEKVPVMKIGGCFAQNYFEMEERVAESERFKIVVPGEVFRCAITPEADNASKISSMKQKLREKKNS